MSGTAARRPEAIVQARLRRSPQDALEAAVVLEAWGGLPAPEALGAGRALMTVSRIGSSNAIERQEPAARRDVLPDAVGLLVTFVLLAIWAPALTRSMGWPFVRTALWVAVPMSLALQWALRSRYLFAQGGLAGLAAERTFALPIGLAVLAAPAVVLGPAGLLGALLAVTCVGTLVLAVRGWAPWQAVAVVLLTVAVALEVPPLAVLGFAAAGSAAGIVAALVGRAPERPTPRPLRRAAAAGAVGAGLGVLFVADPTADWGTGATAFTLVPPVVGAVWGGLHLARLWTMVPRALKGLGSRAGDETGSVAVAVLGASAARLMGATCGLSLLIVGGELLAGAEVSGAALPLAFACLGLAILAVGLLDSLGLCAWAIAAVAAGVAAELAEASTGLVDVPGAGLGIGGAVTLLVALPPLVLALGRPGRMMATSLAIP